MTYLRCPDCQKKGVTLRLRRGGNDNYGCRYCSWFAYTSGHAAVVDTTNLLRLAAANPGVSI